MVFFWANENMEPVHVHIAIGKPTPNTTKVWLTKSGGCIVANNRSRISQPDLAELLEAIRGNHVYICDEWRKFFVETVKFFC